MVNLGQSNSLDEHRSRQATASLRPPDASRIANPGSVSNTEVGRSSWVCHGLTQLRLLFWLLTTLRTPPSGHPATSNCHKRDTTKLMLFPFSCGRCFPCSTQVPSEWGPLPALCVPQLLHDLESSLAIRIASPGCALDLDVSGAAHGEWLSGAGGWSPAAQPQGRLTTSPCLRLRRCTLMASSLSLSYVSPPN